ELGGKATPAVGFALGMERLIALVSATHSCPVVEPHAYVIAEKEYLSEALLLTERLRKEVSGVRIVVDNSGASLKSQFKKADKSGAHYALVLGEQEISQQCVSVKPLREMTEQLRLSFAELVKFFAL
ncbi:MAG: His/Gly/Thr/Pro-type tRNA ligase C-terminal domain-containing protein, partial [Gammaproteobacteria bacterium]